MDMRRHFARAGKSSVQSVLLAGTALALVAAPEAQAQDAEEPQTDDEVIVVSGIRATIQGSIAEKRDNDLIFDALAADEIGDLPALSIAEALETLTGASSHRENGGATEISIRGLGPFLSSTTINGRAATNGSGDRSVNFSQFPSELFNKVGIYKTQSASLIEGGVAGQITLETVKPIDYGKTRVQGEFKLNVNPDNLDIEEDQRFQDLGYRATLSYIDQFQLGDGELGISLGYSRNSSTNPEQEAAISNTLNYCSNVPGSGTGVFGSGNCNTDRPDTAGTEDYVIAQNGYSYRQNITEDERDSFFAALQMQPGPGVDINLDFQYSKRDFREKRHDLNFSEGRRIDGVGDAFGLDYDLITGPYGELYQFTGETSIESNSEYFERREDYYGGGLNFEVEATDRLTFSGDVSYSETKRIEEATQVRMRIRDGEDIFGNEDQYPLAYQSNGSSTDDRVETAYLIAQNGSQIPNFVVLGFDPDNYDLYRDNARVRYDLESDRFNSIFSWRGDLNYEFDGFLKSVQGGVRFQELKYSDVPGASTGTSRIENVYSNEALAIANQACRTAFPESGFLSSVSGGNPLVTIVDENGNVTGSTNTFATWDALCLAQTLEANDPSGLIEFDENAVPIYPDGSFDSIQNSDVREKTKAVYLQANFDGDLGGLPVLGNFGVRVVETTVSSKGFRGALTAEFDDVTGELLSISEDQSTLSEVKASNSYTEFLPSFNLTAEFQPDLLGRFAVYRAMSRPDPSSMSYGRTFNALAEGDTPIYSIEDAIGTANATGNPFSDPLMSWNADVAVEWYPDADSILAVGAYYKSFNGGFETVGRYETFTVDGQDLQTLVTTTNTTDDTSTIWGFEVTAAHRLAWLPQPLDGLGFKLSYNFADSNFEFEDDTLGAITTVNPDGTTTVSEGLIPPANIFGLSKHVLSAQAFYEIGNLELQGVYKYRSSYFQQFVSTPGRVRYVDDTGVFEARISYKLTDNIRLSAEGLNLFNEPRTDYRGTTNNISQVLSYGPRYYFGVRARF